MNKPIPIFDYVDEDKAIKRIDKELKYNLEKEYKEKLNDSNFKETTDYLKKVTIKPEDFLKYLEEKEFLKGFSNEALIEMIFIFREVVEEKNKKIEDLKKLSKDNNI
jgi:hypothetical protein